jgi:plastocyanin
MHLATLHLAPILAAEKSKVPFYIAGGALVVWALIVSLAVGLRRPAFPGAERGQRLVMVISLVLVIAAASTAVITAGGSTKAEASAAPAGPSTQLALAANPSGQLLYNTKQLKAPAGNVTITLTNMSPLPHNLTISLGPQVLGATATFQGGSRTLTLSLKPGAYDFYCSVPGHRQAGMHGTLSVS